VNLKTVITTNVKLSFLQNVQVEHNVFPTIPHEGLQDPISIRMLRANEQLANLHKEDSQAVEYLLDNLEQNGLNGFRNLPSIFLVGPNPVQPTFSYEARNHLYIFRDVMTF
jgi:hypothetical protein